MNSPCLAPYSRARRSLAGAGAALTLLSCTLLSCTLLPAQGATILGNLEAPDSSTGALVGDFPVGSDHYVWAYRFSLPRRSGLYAVDLLTLRLEEFLQADGDPLISFHADDRNGAPGPLLRTFSTSGLPLLSTTQDFEFLPSSPLTLVQNDTYWIVVGQSVNPGNFSWGKSDPATDPTGVATHAGFFFSSDGGVTWAPSSDRPLFELTGRIIPEPGTSALLLLGFGGLCRRRRPRPSPRRHSRAELRNPPEVPHSRLHFF